MKDLEIEKLWQENLSEEKFAKLEHELDYLKNLRTIQTFRTETREFSFIPALVTCSLILVAVFIQFRTYSIDNTKAAEVLLANSNDYLEIYDYYLMEELL